MTPKDLDDAYKESETETPRGSAIILSTIVEAALEECICARLLPMSNNHRDALFDGEAALSSFYAKIDLGFSLGLYGTTTKSDLHLIRRIRNQFAHYSPRSFSHPEVKKHCVNLTDHRPPELVYSPPNPSIKKHAEEAEEFNLRWRFIRCAHFIGVHLYEEIIENNSHPPEPTILP
jgi:hypothetical protein